MRLRTPARERVAVLAMLAGCRAAPMAPVGASTPHPSPEATAARAADAAADLPVAVPADFRRHLLQVGARTLSRGHAERFDAIVWVNEASRRAWDEGADMPDGALLLEEAIERVDGQDRTTALLVMEKHAGTWRFTMADEHGQATIAASETACAGCHRDAPRDFVFRTDAGSPYAAGHK
jgi:hypothetical protein